MVERTVLGTNTTGKPSFPVPVCYHHRRHRRNTLTDFDRWQKETGTIPKPLPLGPWLRQHPEVLAGCLEARAQGFDKHQVAAYAKARGCPPEATAEQIRKAINMVTA